MQLGRLEQRRQDLHGPQGIGHQGPASRPQFCQDERPGGAEGLPGVGQAKTDEFAEDLTHLGRGDEIAGGAEGVAGRVVAVLRVGQGLGHVVGQAQRSLPADALPKALKQGAHLSYWARRCDQTKTPIPIRIMGKDSICPMVAPGRMKPRCWSGSRKNSTDRRARP